MRVGDEMQRLLRALQPAVLGALVRRHRDLPAAEDALQAALLVAAARWPVDGAPDHPKAWLLRVATRRLVDHVRAETARRHREALVVSLAPPDELVALAADEATPERDDSLDLLFLCCHPALTDASAIALTLRAVGGLTTDEIARAFHVPVATMAQRISRAKHAIHTSGAPFQLPEPAARAARRRLVLRVLYLVFNEGYAATTGEAVERPDLAREAIRLARMLHAHEADEPEVTGLLALCLLTDARRPARTGPSGELVPLDRQDRTRWDRAAIAEGLALLHDALPRGAPGPYRVQAAIAALHDEAPSTEATDWPQIVALYEVLLGLEPSPMALLSHAVAFAMVHGPAAGLARLERLAHDPRLGATHRLDAVRAHLLERAGDAGRALTHYTRAAAATPSAAERAHLLAQAARLKAASLDRPST